METTIRLGIIGTGLATTNLHWPALKRLSDKFEITMVSNRTVEKAKVFAELVGKHTGKIPLVTEDPRDVLASSMVDAVVLVLPVELNLEFTALAAKQGKSVLVEKPLAHTMEAAAKMLEVEKENPGLNFMVAENFRYRPVYDHLKEMLSSGQIGQPYYTEWRCWQHVDPVSNPYARTQWRIEHQYEGGFVTDGGVHSIAALRDIFGDLNPAGGFKFSTNPSIGRTDMLSTFFKAGGVTGLYTLGFSAHSEWMDELTLLGTSGSIHVRGTEVITKKNIRGEIITETKGFPDDGGYFLEYEDFYRVMNGKSKPVSTFSKAFGDLKTIQEFLSTAELRESNSF